MKLNQTIIDYIDTLSLSETHKNNYKNLSELSKLIDDCGYGDFFDVCYYIEKNFPNVYSIVSDIVSVNLDQIKQDVSSISSSMSFIAFIEVYCTENGISIYDNDNSDNIDVHSYYYNAIGEIPVLSREEEVELFKIIENGDQSERNVARKTLICRNLRLVVCVASRYNYKLPFDDLVQEGNIGLMEAIDHFDYKRGYKFSTCAFYWIKKCIIRAIRNKSYNISLPYNLHDKIAKYRKAVDTLKNSNSNPSYKEIMDLSGLSYDEIKAIELNCYDTVSLDEIVSDDSDSDLHNFIPDQDSDVENIFDKTELNMTLNTVFKKLGFTDKQIDILSMRFGFYTGVPQTLEEIGNKYGVTRERIRSIISRLLTIIKSNEECLMILAQYMPNSNECFERTYIKRRRSKNV